MPSIVPRASFVNETTSAPRSPSLHRLGAAFVSGILYFLGFAGFGGWPLQLVSFVPCLVAVRGLSPMRAFGWGACFGTVAMLGGFYWVVTTLEQFGGLPLVLALVGCLLLCAFHGLSLALTVGVVRLFDAHLGVRPIWSLALGYAAIEWLFPFLFPHFVGNSLYPVTWLTQVVDVTGMAGLTVWIGLVNGAVYEVVVARRTGQTVPWIPVGAAAAVTVGLLVYGAVQTARWDARIRRAETVRVGLVQANLGAGDKAARRDEFIRRHRAMTRAMLDEHPEVDFVVWPESSYNRWLPRDSRQLPARVFSDLRVPLIFGGLTREGTRGGERRFYNSFILTSSTGDVLQIFDKVVLLAFGEKLPFSETFPKIREWGAFRRISFFTPGTSFENFDVPLEEGTSVKLMPMVCYEDIVPGFVRKMWWRAGPPDALVNGTNDSWYGDSHEPLIHLVLASFRSIETRRALIRSTNTGISAFVDPVGRITERTGQWTQESLVHDVPLVTDGSTTLYVRFGDWLAAGSVAWLAVQLIRVARRRDRRGC